MEPLKNMGSASSKRRQVQRKTVVRSSPHNIMEPEIPTEVLREQHEITSEININANELAQIQRRLKREAYNNELELIATEIAKIHSFIDSGLLLDYARCNLDDNFYRWDSHPPNLHHGIAKEFGNYKGFTLSKSGSTLYIQWSKYPVSSSSSSSSSADETE